MSDELLARLALTDRNCTCPGCKVRRDAAARIRAQAARIAELESLLQEASSTLKAEASTHGHSHWDAKGTHGSNCPLCIDQRNAGGWDMARKIDEAMRADEKEGE